MSPRPSTYSREEILTRALASVLARGPQASLADIGEDVGLTGARVGQLFGSKEGLFVAVARHFGERSRARLDAAMRLDAPPLERLVEGLAEIASSYVRPDEFPNVVHLAFSMAEDAEYARLVADYETLHDGFIRGCLSEAIKRGDLRGVKLDDLVDSVIVVANGVYFTYVLRRDRSLDATLRAQLAALLRPYRAKAVARR